MRLVVVGATGRTGTPLVAAADAAGHEVIAFVRDVDRFEVPLDRVTVVAGDAYVGNGLEEAVTGADAVVCVLGQQPDSPDDLRTVAGENVTDAMAGAGVDRYVTLVSADVSLREESADPPVIERLLGPAGSFVAEKSAIDDACHHVDRVVEYDLDWTVVRSVSVTDGPPSGACEHGSLDPRPDDEIRRPDLVQFLLRVVEEGRYVRELPVVRGE